MEIISLFHAGGFVMYPLLFCSIISIAIAIERFAYYRQANSNMKELPEKVIDHLEKKDITGLVEVLKEDGGFPAMTIYTAAERLGSKADQTVLVESAAARGASQLRNYLNYLDVIVTMSPLLGLLGTVVGMIGSFNVLSISEGQPFAITAGVGEALVATATGLFVAILALCIHTYYSHRLDNLLSDMERLGGIYLSYVKGEGYEA